MSTTLAKLETVERKWYVIDAAGKPLGRTAVIAANLSRRPSGLRKTIVGLNSLAHRTTWLRSDLNWRPLSASGMSSMQPASPWAVPL